MQRVMIGVFAIALAASLAVSYLRPSQPPSPTSAATTPDTKVDAAKSDACPMEHGKDKVGDACSAAEKGAVAVDAKPEAKGEPMPDAGKCPFVAKERAAGKDPLKKP
jgi:hypothetical protein